MIDYRKEARKLLLVYAIGWFGVSAWAGWLILDALI